ncbi:hypothetical protein [Arthrospiribacter ruber]|uniref:SxtJ n=1 Tax=Arthrospiribacter ruber TaxID=2487934 RepID=A0A951M6A8_9BACT|nr:hypothetical protein [Arthrospiribacter ruber]MBW3466391.1 hypothetical protein [Arthrospiribacter ruber]
MKKVKSDPTKTVLVITVGMILLYVIFSWEWAIYVSLTVGVLGMLSAYLAKKIDWFWGKLTFVLSLIVPNVLLSLVFFLLLTPIALASRLFGKKNPLNLKNTEKSLFKSVNKNFPASSFEKPW